MSEAKRMVVAGKSGSGKTYFTKEIVKNMDRIIIFDPEEEYSDLKGFLEVTTLQKVYDILYDNWDTTFKVAYVPPAGFEMEKLHEISLIIEAVGEAFKAGKIKETMLFVVDELNLSFPLTINTVKYFGFAKLASRGRKRGISLIGATQRLAEVATRFRGNIDRVAIFEMAQKMDIEAAAKMVGDGLFDALESCQKFGYVFYENGNLEIKKPI